MPFTHTLRWLKRLLCFTNEKPLMFYCQSVSHISTHLCLWLTVLLTYHSHHPGWKLSFSTNLFHREVKWVPPNLPRWLNRVFWAYRFCVCMLKSLYCIQFWWPWNDFFVTTTQTWTILYETWNITVGQRCARACAQKNWGNRLRVPPNGFCFFMLPRQRSYLSCIDFDHFWNTRSEIVSRSVHP